MTGDATSTEPAAPSTDEAGDADPTGVEPDPPGSLVERLGLTDQDAALLVVAGLLVVAFAPVLFFESWTPRMAILLAVAPAGLALLVRSARVGDLPARLLVAALAWAVVSAVASGGARSALFGYIGRDLSVLTVTLAAGCWALGRTMSDRGRRALVDVFVVAAAASAVVAVAQVVADVRTGPLALASGRPTGFATNPVYLGAVSAAAVGAAVARWSDRSWRWVVAPLAVSAAAVSLSGSRIALLAALLAVGAHAVVHRTRASWTAGLVAVGSLAAGVGLDRVAGAGRNAASRFTEDASSGGRTAVWRYGLEAFTDRPLIGYGFGRFRPAVQGRFSAAFVRDHAPDEVTQAWFDPHNALIAILVAVGIVGFGLFAAWFATWAPRVRGPLVWALIPIGFHWMLQPISLFTLPLAMLMFGAAARPDAPALAPRLGRRAGAIGALVGLVPALALVAIDLAFDDAADDLDAARLASIADLTWRDPIMDDVVAQAYAADPDPASARQVVEWRANAAAAEPDRPYWWSTLAERQIATGDLDGARRSIARARELQPNNLRTTLAEVRLAIETKDEARLDELIELVCVYDESVCDLDPAEVIARERDG